MRAGLMDDMDQNHEFDAKDDEKTEAADGVQYAAESEDGTMRTETGSVDFNGVERSLIVFILNCY